MFAIAQREFDSPSGRRRASPASRPGKSAVVVSNPASRAIQVRITWAVNQDSNQDVRVRNFFMRKANLANALRLSASALAETVLARW